MSLANRGGFRSVSIRFTRSRLFIWAIQLGLRIGSGFAGTIAAAGRSGIEEVYGVPDLDVRCDVCFHAA